jgi:hypothetical protein
MLERIANFDRSGCSSELDAFLLVQEMARAALASPNTETAGEA